MPERDSVPEGQVEASASAARSLIYTLHLISCALTLQVLGLILIHTNGIRYTSSCKINAYFTNKAVVYLV